VEFVDIIDDDDWLVSVPVPPDGFVFWEVVGDLLTYRTGFTGSGESEYPKSARSIEVRHGRHEVDGDSFNGPILSKSNIGGNIFDSSLKLEYNLPSFAAVQASSQRAFSTSPLSWAERGRVPREYTVSLGSSSSSRVFRQYWSACLGVPLASST
jgi:hypothetical protein